MVLSLQTKWKILRKKEDFVDFWTFASFAPKNELVQRVRGGNPKQSATWRKDLKVSNRRHREEKILERPFVQGKLDYENCTKWLEVDRLLYRPNSWLLSAFSHFVSQRDPTPQNWEARKVLLDSLKEVFTIIQQKLEWLCLSPKWVA